MPSKVGIYIQELEKVRRNLSSVKNDQLHSQRLRDDLRSLVEQYFNEVRINIVDRNKQDDDISLIDNDMQELNVLCHRRGRTKRYKQLLKELKSRLIVIDTRLISNAGLSEEGVNLESIDKRIITTLQALVPSAALSYQQAINDLHEIERLSWRGPATDLREALREALDHLAPDKEVVAMPGYKQSNETDGPTMKQKVRFIMKKRGVSKAISGPAEMATDSIEEALSGFIRSVYTRSSVSTHTPTDKAEVLRIRDLTRVVLSELLVIHS